LKTREEVARFVERQLGIETCGREKGDKYHYGLQELRELMDFVYGGPPENEGQALYVEYLSKQKPTPMPNWAALAKDHDARTAATDAEILKRLIALRE
jgi:hypothetical protein